VMVNRKGGPGARTYNIHFPKAPDPVHTYGQVITFLKTQMQEKYGGAHVHEDIIYKSAMQQLEEEKGKSAVFSPIKWRILTDLYLSDGFSKEHKRLSNYLYNLNKWESAKVDNTLEELFREGYLDADWKKYDYVLRGRDENNAQLGQPVRQSVQDDLERVRTTVYTLSKKGKELFLGYFARAAASKRSGGPVHLRAIRREVENTYWRIGNFCFIDWGEDFKEKPDIFVLSPRQIRISPDKNNKELQTWVQDAYSWDYDRAINVEVETYPLKNEDQVFRNFLKANGREVRFVVLDTKHIEDIHTILSVRHAIDRSKYTVDYAPFESLNNELVYQTIAAKPNEESVGPPDLARTVAETAAQASQEAPVNEQQRASDVEAVQEAKQETRQSSSAREKREERNDKKTAMKGIVELMSGEGFPGISKLAEKFSVSQKTISRYLKELEERGIVQKDVAGSYALSTEFKDHLAQTRKRRTENLAAPD
jgi:DNA-binding transcriptional ArsR family regulator